MSNISLCTLFLDLLVNNRTKLDEFHLHLSEKIQQYLVIIINNHPVIFSDIEQSLNKIVSDGKIDVKDTPEILLIVGKIYELIYKSKHITVKTDYFDIISNLMLVASTLYLQNDVLLEKDTIQNLNNIVQSSIELIKLKSSIKSPKFKLF